MTRTHRLRVCYGKVGRLRFLGHLEVCRALERGVRRARLPIAYGHGYHPKARLAFGPALPVGVAGAREYVDLLLADYVAPAEAAAALSAALPEGLPVNGAGYVAQQAPSLTVVITAAAYRVELVGLTPADGPALGQGLARLAAMPTISVERRGTARTYELATALLRPLKLVQEPAAPTLEMWLRFADQAPIRPDAIASEVTAGVQRDHFVRVARMECYSERPDGLVAASEVG